MADEKQETAAPPRRRLPVPKPLLWVLGILASLALILYIASYFIDEPLRKITEQKVNRDLKGYSVKIPELHLQLIGLSLTIKGLTVIQQAHPDPPVAYFPYLKASVHWREILSGKVVGELDIDKPRLNINLPQLEAEVASKVPMKKKGWQQAVEDIYPLKINLLKISEANITYIDQDPKRPLVLSHLNISADNIRNIHLPDRVFPSPFHLDTNIFGKGEGVIDGKANFLAEPTPAVNAKIKLDKVPLDYFKPVLARANVEIAGGSLRARGDVIYTPKEEVAHLKEVVISGLNLQYVHSDKTIAAEKKRGQAVAKTAKKVSNKPEVQIQVDNFELAKCNLGMLNDTGGKRYRVFLSDADFQLTNFSNQFSKGPAKMRLNGRFMGSGATTATGDFRAEKNAPDFDLFLKIDNTQLTAMNDLLRAYGNFDVAAGTFSLVTELHAKHNQLTGYIKPFFKDMKVYDKRKDKDKSLFHKVYEMLIGGVAKLLENRPREQVATKADISGSLKSPQTSTWQIIVQLVRNAFIKAILPTFEHQVRTGKP
ncbi:DUF748 domain-containing protein [Geomonas sp.]|uniref:DUF748 domain-containing protein n=1 Tax=Geomonas sp. TaxID=2651584 RepID=UPI002B45A716|nr:DUF748 domain-containing protein [Geomonas sp.]HJV36131.1 DUF748 domain-containing protein [Geomonas sp.]